MDWKLELIAVPVSDVDRAKSFYLDQLGFELLVDHSPNDAFRIVQMVPPGSACAIAFGKGLKNGAQTEGPDAERSDYNTVFSFDDPDGNAWLVQEVGRTG